MIPRSKAEKPNTLRLLWRKLAQRVTGRAKVLFLMQLTLLGLLAAIFVLVLAVDEGVREATYAALVLGLTAVLLIAVRLNLKGRYNASARITMLGIAAAPWASLAIDPKILQGDIIPLIYIVLSIHLCATFLNEGFTAAIAAVQLMAVAILLAVDPNFASVNWPSFCAYIVCASVIGITTSFITRKHMEQIEAQNQALKASEEQLRILSTRDPLTGQYNRRYMEETLAREISRMLRKGSSLGLMITDLNGFKGINDTRGHIAGDSALCRAASLLNRFTRKSDVVCRFGGDEFVMILPDCSREIVEARRDEIIRALATDPGACGGDSGCLSMSFGIAMLPQDGVTAEALLQAADEALYADKRQQPLRP